MIVAARVLYTKQEKCKQRSDHEWSIRAEEQKFVRIYVLLWFYDINCSQSIAMVLGEPTFINSRIH